MEICNLEIRTKFGELLKINKIDFLALGSLETNSFSDKNERKMLSIETKQGRMSWKLEDILSINFDLSDKESNSIISVRSSPLAILKIKKTKGEIDGTI